jgi:chaperone LolA
VRRLPTAALIFFFAAVPCAGDAALTLPDVLAQVEAAQAKIHDIQFRFIQKTTALDGRPLRTSGRLFFKRPYSLKINQTEPENQILVSDGQRVSLYSPAAGQQIVGEWRAWVERSGFPTVLLTFIGDFPVQQWRDRYTLVFGGYDDGVYRITLNPKQAGDIPVELWISEKDFLPMRGKARYTNANVDVRFEGTRVNAGLRNDIFQAKVPQGTPVIPLQ